MEIFNFAKEGNLAKVQEWISKGENLDIQNEKGTSMLMICALEGWNDMALSLIESKCNLNFKNYFGYSALSIAITNCKEDKLALALIAAGCDVNIQNGMGFTPLHLASTRNKKDIVDALIDTGHCDLGKRDFDHMTAFRHLCNWEDMKEMARRLIRAGYTPDTISIEIVHAKGWSDIFEE